MKTAVEREIETVEAMINLYCSSHPESETECNKLKKYVHERLKDCPYQDKKPTCKKCTIHCYDPAMREKIKKVMRYSGPRIILHRPVLALHHLIHTLKK